MPVKSIDLKNKPTTVLIDGVTYSIVVAKCAACNGTGRASRGGACVPCVKFKRIVVVENPNAPKAAPRSSVPKPIPTPPKPSEYIPPPTNYGDSMEEGTL